MILDNFFEPRKKSIAESPRAPGSPALAAPKAPRAPAAPRLEEDDEMYNAPEKSNHTIKTLESILRQSNYFIEKMKATPEDAFFRGAAKGAEAIKSYIEKAIQNNK